MRNRAAIIFAVALVAPTLAVFAALVSAQESSSPGVVVGDQLPCPGGGSVQSRYELNGNAWSVTGILTASLTGSITVAGPSGDVTATPTVNLTVTGNPQIGQPVTMEGTLGMIGEMVATSVVNACGGPGGTPTTSPGADTSGPINTSEPDDQSDDGQSAGDDNGNNGDAACDRGAGHAGELRMHINHGGVHIQRGTVASFDGSNLVVQTPSGEMTVQISDHTHLNGDPAAASEVKVRGELDDGGVVLADEVKALCTSPNAADQSSDDHGNKHGNGHGKDKNHDGNKARGGEDSGAGETGDD